MQSDIISVVCISHREAMEDVLKKGLTKTIGVSNLGAKKVSEMKAYANQV